MKWFRRVSICALVAAAAVLATTAPSSRAALVCPGQTTVQPFLRFGDSAYYVMLPNGSLESSTGWKLSGGAAIVKGNESYYVNNASDAHSLSLPPGASATSSSLCVTLFHPDLRFFARNTGSSTATLRVNVITTVAGLLPVTTPVATLTAGSSWQPTPTLPYLTNLLAPLTSGVQFTFTAVGSGGAWQIDDVYVDPFKER